MRNPVFIWNYIFSLLSLESFNMVKDLLRFPTDRDDFLYQLSRDFVITYTKERGLTTPYTPVTNLIPAQHIKINRMNYVLSNAIDLLNEKSKYSTVYKWGTKTHDNYDYKDVENLFACCRLLFEAAITTASRSNHLTLTDRDYLIIDYWNSIYERNSKGIPEQLPALTEEKMIIFYDIMLKSGYEKAKLEMMIHWINALPITTWDKVIVRPFLLSWVSLEGKFRICLDTWVFLEREIGIDEITNWAEQYYHDYKISNFDIKNHFDSG